MIKFSGRLNRPEYWKTILFALIALILSSSILLWLLDIQDAEVPGASMLNQTLAIILFIMLLLSAIYFTVLIISAVVRRAHDTKSSTLWLLLGLFIPFGYVIIGLVPSNK